MKKKSVSVGILGLGNCVPEKILNNFDLEKMVDTTDEWIMKRTGISERRILGENEPTYKLGIEAAQDAVTDAGLTSADIDLIIVTSSTPDYLVPSTSCLIQKGIGAVNAAAFDLVAACTGFIYGITVAKQFVETGFYKNVLVVSTEGMSKVTEWKDRNTCVLFGDAAGAAVIGVVEDGYGIMNTYIAADGTLSDSVTIPCLHQSDEDSERRSGFENKRTLWQDGQEIFKFAVKILSHASEKVINDAGLSIDDIKYIVPHQANIRIIESGIKRLGFTMEKVYTTIQKFGNISSASIPVALTDAYKGNFLKKGDKIVLVAFGGGLTWGATLINWSK